SPTKEPHSEPSLIDPDLHIGFSLEQGVPSLGVTASYEALSGLGRAEYLAWLAGGRKDPHIPREFIRIFLCGIERRLLIDIARDDSLRSELDSIRDAVVDLAMTYQRMMYPGFTDEIADALEILGLDPVQFASDPASAPDIDMMPWIPPDILPLGLGCFTAQRTPIPADWAFTWAWYRPEVPTRTPMHRAPQEYQELFIKLYREQFKQGMVLRRGKKTARVTATATNQSIGYVTLDLSHIPDVFARQKPIEDLRLLAIRASSKLDGYSRWIQKNPYDADTLAAIAQYPPELISQELPAAQEFFLWITERMDDRSYVELTGADLFEVWSVTAPQRDRLTPKEAQSLGYVFGWFGFGIEPDFRLGKPALDATMPVIVFRRDSVEGERRYAPIPTMSSESFHIASLATHLTLALIAVEQVVTPDVIPLVIAELDGLFEMDALEKARLHAYLLLQIEKPLKVTGHKSRIVGLSEHQREVVAAFVISVAARHGSISPQIVKLVGQLYAQLDLDRTRVSSDLHGAMTSSSPSPVRRPGGSAIRTEVRLDRGIIARKEREASEVSTL
ncbi:MAG TPA: TerB N-terminal domain-containing protein, partial [Thermomicrobiales bacterium]|nr:TerB N-terminal domain-containing protein [Thermomicrobiales bacterium]